jgi:hypothetical protein
LSRSLTLAIIAAQGSFTASFMKIFDPAEVPRGSNCGVDRTDARSLLPAPTAACDKTHRYSPQPDNDPKNIAPANADTPKLEHLLMICSPCLSSLRSDVAIVTTDARAELSLQHILKTTRGT